MPKETPLNGGSKANRVSARAASGKRHRSESTIPGVCKFNTTKNYLSAKQRKEVLSADEQCCLVSTSGFQNLIWCNVCSKLMKLGEKATGMGYDITLWTNHQNKQCHRNKVSAWEDAGKPQRGCLTMEKMEDQTGALKYPSEVYKAAACYKIVPGTTVVVVYPPLTNRQHGVFPTMWQVREILPPQVSPQHRDASWTPPIPEDSGYPKPAEKLNHGAWHGWQPAQAAFDDRLCKPREQSWTLDPPSPALCRLRPATF